MKGTGWKENAQGVWVINEPLVPSEVFVLKADTKVVNDGGYKWTRVSETAAQKEEEPVFAAGDRVRIRPSAVQTVGTKRYGPTYTGGRFRLWHDSYTVRSVQGNRAVLSVAGIPAAAVNTAVLEYSA
jgi:hypothetical protein